MKKVLTCCMSFILIFGLGSTQLINAAEVTNEETTEKNSTNEIAVMNDGGSSQKDEILSKFNADSVQVKSYYIDKLRDFNDQVPCYDVYKNYNVLYQQRTGVNTLSSLYFDLNIDNSLTSTRIPLNVSTELMNGYKVVAKIKTNPAEVQGFVDVSQEFKIVLEITLSKDGQEPVTVEKEVNSKVVEVVGKIINRKASLKKDICFRINGDNVNETLKSTHKNFKVQLLNGTVIDVIGFNGQGGGAGNGEGNYTQGVSSIYDLKYILEGSTSDNDMITEFSGYILDKDDNLVTTDGRIVVPFKNRKVKEFTSSIPEIKFNTLVGTFPDSAILKTTKRTDLNLNKQYVAYDVNVVCNGEKTQPIGSVNIAISLPKTLVGKDITVYYIDDKGKLVDMQSKVNEDSVTFTTSNLSTYVVMENEVNTPKPSQPTDTPNPSETKNPTETKKPDTGTQANTKGSVKTGDSTTKALNLSLLVMSAGILIALKKKQELSNK